MQWVAENWREVAQIAGVVVGGLTVAVGAISGLTKWKGDDKVWSWLKWLHDRLSPFALGNQKKLGG